MSLKEFLHEQNLDQNKEFIFFAGSFNPWHEGHSECLRLMDGSKPIIIIPDRNPEKDLSANDNLDLEQLESKTQSINKSSFLFNEFYLQNKKNPTSHWIEELKEEFPNNEISLLMGYDSFNSLDKWIKAHELINHLSHLYVASRLETNEQREKSKARLNKINPNLKIHFLGHHDFEEISSTQIREQE